MWRKLMSRFLRADLDPGVAWSDIDSMTIEARVSVELPRFGSRTETLEQLLCTSGDHYVLFKRWAGSGLLVRICFSRSLDGREMRLTERQPGPPALYRLQLSPVETAGAVTYVAARPTWFGLWRNEDEQKLGPTICHIESADRKQLADLRLKLLDGKLPESLQTEEEMWQRIHSMSESDRRAAYAALASKSLGELDRQFNAMHPDLGPVPEALRPAVESMQQRIQEIGQTAAANPPDAKFDDLMQRFVADATRNASSTQSDLRPSEELERKGASEDRAAGG